MNNSCYIKSWLEHEPPSKGTIEAVDKARATLDKIFSDSEIKETAAKFNNFLIKQPITYKQGFSDSVDEEGNEEEVVSGNEYYTEVTEAPIIDPKDSIEHLMNWLPSFTLMGPLDYYARPFSDSNMTLSQLTASLVLFEAFEGSTIAAIRGSIILDMLNNVSSGDDIRNVAEDILQESLKYISPNTNEFNAIQGEQKRHAQKKYAQIKRPDALQGIILEIVKRLPDIKQQQLKEELDDYVGKGVIETITSEEIEWTGKDGTANSSPITGLKDRLSKAKKIINQE